MASRRVSPIDTLFHVNHKPFSLILMVLPAVYLPFRWTWGLVANIGMVRVWMEMGIIRHSLARYILDLWFWCYSFRYLKRGSFAQIQGGAM